MSLELSQGYFFIVYVGRRRERGFKNRNIYDDFFFLEVCGGVLLIGLGVLVVEN
jgi:hypothetical protein